MKHILIVGARGVGKSTLIRRVLKEMDRPVFGFETKKESALANDVKGSPIYIYEAGKPHMQTEENRIGYCLNHRPEPNGAAFDRFVPLLRRPVSEDHVILMDELGFLEAASESFCSAVMERLDGDVLVIAAVKKDDFPFLEAVRNHKNAKCFYITPENRDALFKEVMHYVRTSLGE